MNSEATPAPLTPHPRTIQHARAKSNFLSVLYLNSLTSLPANAKLTAGGDLYLNSLTSLPANAKLTAGGDL